MNSKRAAIFSLGVVLVLGILLGMAIDRYVIGTSARPPFERKRPHDFTRHLSKQLQLNDQQQAQLKVLLDGLRAKHDSLRKEATPQFRRIQEEFRQQFSSLLTPEQQETFKKMIEHEKPRE